jgi:predicted aspartyl protease
MGANLDVFKRIVIVVAAFFGSFTAQAGMTPWIDFTIYRGFLVIDTKILGIDGFSVIDTGAQISMIQSSFITNHDLKLEPAGNFRITGVNGEATRKSYRDVSVNLMGSATLFKRLVEVDLDDRMQVLIGGDFLQNLYFQFDYPNKRLRGITRDSFNLKKIKNVVSKLDPATKQPMVKVRLNDEVNKWLVIDTGNSGGILLRRSAAKRFKWLDRYSAEQGISRGVATSAGVETFRLPVIGIGPFNVKNARVTVPQEGGELEMFKRDRSRSSQRQKTQGLLGYDVLKNFLVTIDYKSGALFIEIPEAVPVAESDSGD